MAQGGGLRRQHDFGRVQLGPLQGFQSGDLGQGQIGEQAQEPPHIGVVGAAPELPIVVRADAVSIQPHRARRRLAHFRPGRRGDQRRGQAVQGLGIDAPGQLNAANDITPLIRAAELQNTVHAAAELQEVVGLEHHIVEFQKAQWLLAIQTQLHAVKAHHAVDRHVGSVIPQELDVFQIVQPVGVVEHDCIAGAVAKGQKLRKHVLDPGHVGGNAVIVQHLPGFVPARRVADLGGPAAHQNDGLVAGALHVPQHHDLHQIAHMEARRRAIEADVTGHRPGAGQRPQTVTIRLLVNELSFLKHRQKV